MEGYVRDSIANTITLSIENTRFLKIKLIQSDHSHELVYYLSINPSRESKKTYKTGLIIGRFQPFHKGHLYLCKKALEIVDRLEIGVGSSQIRNNPKNPFTFEERKKLIEDALSEEKIQSTRYNIHPIPDLFNFEKWIDSIFRIIEDFDVIFTNNLWIGRLIQQREKSLIYGLKYDFKRYNGTRIRNIIRSGENEWKKLVPPSSIIFLDEWKESFK